MFKNLKPREPERIPGVLRTIQMIWEEKPQLRLGQLLLNAVPNGTDPYNIEDEELEAMLLEFYYKTCGCGFKDECVLHCNHEAGLCPGNSYKPS